MSRRTLIAAAALVLGLPTLAAATGAPSSSAASLGGLSSQSLAAWTITGGPGTPTVAVWDSFTRPNGTNLTGQTTGAGGPAWQVVSGTWTTAANSGRLSSNTQDAAVVVECDQPDLTVVATMTPANGNFSGGLTLKQTGLGFLAVDYSSENGGRIELARMLFGGRTVLAGVTGVGRVTPATLSAAYAGGTITIRLNGVTWLTHTLSGVDEWLYGTSTRAGLYAGADTQSAFDNFRCEY
jgi:hypothetical protein